MDTAKHPPENPITGRAGEVCPPLPYLIEKSGARDWIGTVTLQKEQYRKRRSALTAVMRRMLDAPGVFDENGWLTVGFYGHQPSIAETYISTGSSYLCSAAWLPLRFPASDPFWSGPAMPWTSRKIWSGEQVVSDHALAE
jgi:hypothetical protein